MVWIDMACVLPWPLPSVSSPGIVDRCHSNTVAALVCSLCMYCWCTVDVLLMTCAVTPMTTLFVCIVIIIPHHTLSNNHTTYGVDSLILIQHRTSGSRVVHMMVLRVDPTTWMTLWTVGRRRRPSTQPQRRQRRQWWRRPDSSALPDH